MSWLLDRLIAVERKARELAKEWIRRASYARTAARLKGVRSYSYTTDYVSAHQAGWGSHLADLAGRPDVRCLEIGSYEGRSAVWFLQHVLTHPTATLTCVDPNALPRFQHNLRIAGAGDKVRHVQRRSEEVLASLPEERFDVIYVDGSHRALNVLFDAVASTRLLKRGGILILDDYLWEPDRPVADRPQMAIDLFLDSFRTRFEVLEQGYQVILKKR